MLAVYSGASMGYRYEIFNRPFHHELAYPKNFIPDSRGGEGKIIGHNKGSRASPYTKSLVSRFSQEPRFTTVVVIIRAMAYPKLATAIVCTSVSFPSYTLIGKAPAKIACFTGI